MNENRLVTARELELEKLVEKLRRRVAVMVEHATRLHGCDHLTTDEDDE